VPLLTLLLAGLVLVAAASTIRDLKPQLNEEVEAAQKEASELRAMEQAVEASEQAVGDAVDEVQNAGEDEKKLEQAERKLHEAREKARRTREAYEDKYTKFRKRLKKSLNKMQGDIRRYVSGGWTQAGFVAKAAKSQLVEELNALEQQQEEVLKALDQKIGSVSENVKKYTKVPAAYWKLRRAYNKATSDEERQKLKAQMLELEAEALEVVWGFATYASQLFLMVFLYLGIMHSRDLEKRGPLSPEQKAKPPDRKVRLK